MQGSTRVLGETWVMLESRKMADSMLRVKSSAPESMMFPIEAERNW